MDVTFVYESLLFEGDSPPASEVADLVDTLSRLEDLGIGFATEFPDFTEVRTSSFFTFQWRPSFCLTIVHIDLN